MSKIIIVRDDTLQHHGILGQKWGIRRFQDKNGKRTPEGKERYSNENKANQDAIKNRIRTLQKECDEAGRRSQWSDKYYNAQDKLLSEIGKLGTSCGYGKTTTREVEFDRSAVTCIQDKKAMAELKNRISSADPAEVSKLQKISDDYSDSIQESNKAWDEYSKKWSKDHPGRGWNGDGAEFHEELRSSYPEYKKIFDNHDRKMGEYVRECIKFSKGKSFENMKSFENFKNYFDYIYDSKNNSFWYKLGTAKSFAIAVSLCPKMMDNNYVDPMWFVENYDGNGKRLNSPWFDEPVNDKDVEHGAMAGTWIITRTFNEKNSLSHHGIRGQQWGKKNGPPYPLKGGDYSKSEVEEIYKARKAKNSIYNKRHFDGVLKADKTTLRTLSYDKKRTQDSDMFYAATNFFDKKQYDAIFNGPAPKSMVDENGESIGSGIFCKYAIDNKLTGDMKVASEDSGAKIFGNLYQNNRDFYNFVTSDDRLSSYFDKSKFKFKGYREANESLQKAKSGEPISEDDIKKIYRMFNYSIPYDGRGNEKAKLDMAKQRAKFFKAAKEAGYGAILDINDGIYGSFKARQPVIVFDMESVIPDKIKRTNITSKAFSTLVTSYNHMTVSK